MGGDEMRKKNALNPILRFPGSLISVKYQQCRPRLASQLGKDLGQPFIQCISGWRFDAKRACECFGLDTKAGGCLEVEPTSQNPGKNHGIPKHLYGHVGFTS